MILEHLNDAEFLELQGQDSLREFEEDLEASLADRSTAQMESSRPVDQAEAEVEEESRFINNGRASSRDMAGYDTGDTKHSLRAGGDTKQIPYGLCSAAARGRGNAEQGGGSWSGGDGGGGGHEPEGGGEKGNDHPKEQSLIEHAVEAFRKFTGNLVKNKEVMDETQRMAEEAKTLEDRAEKAVAMTALKNAENEGLTESSLCAKLAGKIADGWHDGCRELNELRNDLFNMVAELSRSASLIQSLSEPTLQHKSEASESATTQRGNAPSRELGRYDSGDTKDCLWCGGCSRSVPSGLKRLAGGNDDDGRDEGLKSDGGNPEQESSIIDATEQDHLMFKDAVGREFSFPLEFCGTWDGMRDLISQAFQYVETLGPLAREGRYYLLGPVGERLEPESWEMAVEGRWKIEMHMWPMRELVSPKPGVLKMVGRLRGWPKTSAKEMSGVGLGSSLNTFGMLRAVG